MNSPKPGPELVGQMSRAMAYVAMWDSATNQTSHYYSAIGIPSVTLPGEGAVVVFRSQIAQQIHKAISAERKEDPALWKVASCAEPIPEHFAIAVVNESGTDMRVYSARFSP